MSNGEAKGLADGSGEEIAGRVEVTIGAGEVHGGNDAGVNGVHGFVISE